MILGTMNIGYNYSSNNNNTNDYYKLIIEEYIKLTDKSRILDTAYYYGNTKTEQILGEILQDLDHIKIATKVNPWYLNDFTNGQLGQLSSINIKRQLNTSITNLKQDIDTLFLHCPDYETPIIETLETCNDLYRQEKFNHFGISNFSKVQMEEILELCENNKLINPSYYQGMYNIISRKVEQIFPLLNDHNIHFWAYNPLAGGLLTGKYSNNILLENNRFKNNTIYQNIFWKEPILKSFEQLLKSKDSCEYSLNWINRKIIYPNQIILGVSTVEQLRQNIMYLNSNYTNNYDVDKMYKEIESFSPNYYY